MMKIMFKKKIDTTLEYHVAHSNPHMLFEKMVELGFASSNSDAFEKCWNSLMKTEAGTNYLYELNDFLYHCCQHFAPQIKKNGNSKSIKYRYTEHDSSGTLGESEEGCSCDSPNLDHLIKLQKGREFYDVYQKSEWVVCDSKILYLFGKLFEGGGLEGAISYRQEAGFAWCSVSWYPAVAKGVGTRTEATDAMDGDGGTDTKTAIEVHFTPSYMFFPIHNSRMQKWFYRHVFTEGIGLRQLIDYYFVLVKSEERRVKNLTALQRELKFLGLWKFAGAVMYVLHEALGLPEAKMIALIDVNEGRFLLAEIMQGGNFGQYDTRLGSKENEGKLHRYLRMSLRNLRFVKHYPTEALSEPLFSTWFAVWKKINGIK